MKRIIWILLIGFVSSTGVDGQVTGLWKVVDDDDGVEKSIIEIFEQDNMYYGRIVELLETSKRTHCEKCDGQLKNMPLTGMIIVYDLKKTNKGGNNGKVVHPGTGKIYSLNVELVTPDRLKLRGYVGMPTIGKTSYWNRVKQ
jgi:uncharacterized protein (DUF2147 family)